jgi:hypothetical protein
VAEKARPQGGIPRPKKGVRELGREEMPLLLPTQHQQQGLLQPTPECRANPEQASRRRKTPARTPAVGSPAAVVWVRRRDG